MLRAGPEALDGVLESGIAGSILELDDVAARNDLSATGLDDWCREGEGKESGQSEVHGD